MDTVCGTVVEAKYQMLKATILAETGFVESINAFQSYRDTTDTGALDLAYIEAEDPLDGDHFPARNTWMWVYLEADISFIEYLLSKLGKTYHRIGRMNKIDFFDDYSKRQILQITIPISYHEFAYLLSLQRNGISYKRFILQILRQIKNPRLLPLSNDLRKELINEIEKTTD